MAIPPRISKRKPPLMLVLNFVGQGSFLPAALLYFWHSFSNEQRKMSAAGTKAAIQIGKEAFKGISLVSERS